jgi:hypothetical protein
VDYVDLYQIHRFDHDTPIEETLKLTLDRLCNDEAEIMAKPVFEPLPPMSDRIGVAKHRLHPDLAARADFDGTSRHVVCPKEVLLRRLLRPHCWCGACEQQTGREIAPPHSITSSPRASNDGGMVRFSKRAVFKLMYSSNRAGCSTGMSAGLAPLMILSICAAAGRVIAKRSGSRLTNPPAMTVTLKG